MRLWITGGIAILSVQATLAQSPTIAPGGAKPSSVTKSSVTSAATTNANPTATQFNGVEYQLAWVDAGDRERATTNEYITEGETVESWSSMIAVRQWPNSSLVRDVTGPYLRQIQPHFVRNAQVFQPENVDSSTELVIECYLAPPDKSYLEYNLIRFGIEPGEKGVKSYQYALRGPYNLESAIEFNQPKLAERLNELTALRQKVVTKLPNTEKLPSTESSNTQRLEVQDQAKSASQQVSE